MFDLDKWQEIFYTITNNKLRTGLTAMGVFWGIFMLTLLLGSGKGMENGVMAMFGDSAKNALYIWPQRSTMPYKGFKAGRRVQYTMDDVHAIIDNVPQVEVVAPRFGMGSLTFVRNEKSEAYEVRGETQDFIKIEPTNIILGRYINALDVEKSRKIIVIGKQIRDIFFEEDEDVVGQYIQVGGIDYLISGVFTSKRQGEDAAEDERTAYVPITTVQRIRNLGNKIGWFVCTINGNVSAFETKIIDVIKQRHNIHPDDDQAIGHFNLEEEFNQFQGLFIAINLFVWFVGIGTLIAGIVSVGNVMLIVVKERTREIGIRKSLGATPGSIISMILMESVFITAISGYIGLLVGAGLLWLIATLMDQFGVESMFFANPEVNMTTGLISLLILVCAGTFAGLIPAIQASKVNPVDALKDE
ncbi:MAG: ABC transporter permease [Bacteroidia bacterium]|nr:ABC transporter permease [Bacteroidia bacterium]